MDDVKASMLRTVRGLLEATEAGRQTWEQGEMGELLGSKTKLADGRSVTIAGGPMRGTSIAIESWHGPSGELEFSLASRTFHGNAEAARLRRLAFAQMRAARRAKRLPRVQRRALAQAHAAADRERHAASEQSAVRGL